MTDALVKRIATYLAVNNSTSAGIPDDPAKAAALWHLYKEEALEIAKMVVPALAALQAVKDYVSHQPLELMNLREIQSDLLAIVSPGGEE